MNTRNNLLFFISIFPVFIIRSNFNTIEIVYIFFIIFLLLFFNFFFLKYINKKSHILIKLYLSFIFVYGIDNHLGLFNGLIQPNLNYIFKYFQVVYIPALIIFIFLILIIFLFLIKLNQEKSTKILLITIITLMTFNLFDNSKNYKNITFFENYNSKQFNETTVILIFDEMSGLNSLSSESEFGQSVNNNFIKLFNKYNFNYYSSIYSNSKNTVSSIASLINFEISSTKENRKKFVSLSKDYFTEYEIRQNKLFNKYKSISVIQNMHINFCKNSNVTACYQYNPFKLDIIGAEIDSLSKIISNWNINGSIVAKFLWRLFKQFEIINSTLEPEGEKKFTKEILNYTLKKINSKKFDLVFMHILVPHTPYGYDQNCFYDSKISNLNIYMTNKNKIKQHNIERNCIINFLDKFMGKINNLENKKIFILSDHGSRIDNAKNSSLSTVFAYKNYNSKNSIEIFEENMHKEFKFLYNE